MNTKAPDKETHFDINVKFTFRFAIIKCIFWLFVLVNRDLSSVKPQVYFKIVIRDLK